MRERAEREGEGGGQGAGEGGGRWVRVRPFGAWRSGRLAGEHCSFPWPLDGSIGRPIFFWATWRKEEAENRLGRDALSCFRDVMVTTPVVWHALPNLHKPDGVSCGTELVFLILFA